jgi:hypothetical protein
MMSQIRNTLPPRAYSNERLRALAKTLRAIDQELMFGAGSQPPDHPDRATIARGSQRFLRPTSTNALNNPDQLAITDNTQAQTPYDLVRGEPANPGFLNKGLELRLC